MTKNGDGVAAERGRKPDLDSDLFLGIVSLYNELHLRIVPWPEDPAAGDLDHYLLTPCHWRLTTDTFSLPPSSLMADVGRKIELAQV